MDLCKELNLGSMGTPTTIKTLTRHLVSTMSPFHVTQNVELENSRTLPYLQPLSALATWLACKTSTELILRTNTQHTLPMLDAILDGGYIGERDSVLEPARHSKDYAEAWDGSDWIPSIIRGGQDVLQKYLECKNNGLEAIFCHIDLHADGLSFMGSASQQKNLNLVTISLSEFPKGFRTEGSKLVNFPVALHPVRNGTNLKPIDIQEVLKVLTPDFERLSEGVDIYSIALGRTVRVFAFPFRILGDYPARCEMISHSTSAANHPCYYCPVRHYSCRASDEVRAGPCDMGCLLEAGPCQPECFDDQSFRTNSITGVLGFNSPAEVLNWPSLEFPFSVSIDLMHQAFLGDCRRHFLRFGSELERGKTKVQCEEMWKLVSQEFGRLLMANKITAKYYFKDLNSWAKDLGAYSIMLFVKLSCLILRKLRLITYSLEEPFHVWRRRVHVTELLCSDIIRAADMDILKGSIVALIRACCRRYSNIENGTRISFCTINTHMLLHYPACIRKHGPPRSSWCFPYELKIGNIKRLLENTNNQDVPKHLFRRIHINHASQLALEISKPLSIVPGLIETIQDFNLRPSVFENVAVAPSVTKLIFGGRCLRVGQVVYAKESSLVSTYHVAQVLAFGLDNSSGDTIILLSIYGARVENVGLFSRLDNYRGGAYRKINNGRQFLVRDPDCIVRIFIYEDFGFDDQYVNIFIKRS